jgi:hypothetical protein
VLASCDSAGGGGACGGVDNNGVCLFVSSIEPFDVIGPTIDVDVVFTTADCNADGTPDDPEPFSDHDAVVNFGSFTIGNVPTTSTRIFITSYTITYALNPGAPPAPNPPSFTTSTGSVIEVPTNGSAQANVTIFNQEQKFGYVVLFGGNPADEVSYTATYTFRGEDEFGNSVFVNASQQILLADFFNC